MAKKAQTTEGPAAGHNSGDMAEKDRKVLFFIGRKNYLEALAAKKTADAKLKLVGKGIKADLGEYGLDQIKAYEKAQTPDGQAAIKAEMEATRQALRFAGVPINTQLDLLEDLAPLAERAYSAGEEAGLKGETLANPYNEGSFEGQEFARGWHDGQGALFAGIRKKEEEGADAENELIKGGDDSDEDPFEAAA